MFYNCKCFIRLSVFYKCAISVLLVCYKGFMYSADADGRGRTWTFHFYLIFNFFIFGMHISTGPIGARPRVRLLGSPPSPHAS